MMYVEFIKNFFLVDSSELKLLESFCLLSPKTFDSDFLDMMYVELMKKFFLTDSSEVMAVRVISAYWAQKLLIPTFKTWCTWSSLKIFFSPIRANWWVLESFRPPEPKNFWYELSKHDVRRVLEKFFSHRFQGSGGRNDSNSHHC